MAGWAKETTTAWGWTWTAEGQGSVGGSRVWREREEGEAGRSEERRVGKECRN